MATEDGVQDVFGPTVAWRSAGPPDAPVAVFLHGLGGDRLSWEPQLEGLSHLRRCCAWELPGYGRSPGLVQSLPLLASLAAEWIAELSDDPVDIVGLSFGGMVAQHLALDHPRLVRTLALLDTSPAFGLDGVTTAESWLASRISPPGDPSPERFARIVDAMVGPGASVEVRRTIAASMQAVPPASLDASCRALVDHDTRDRLHRISAPTLVLVGEADPETPPGYARQIACRLQDVRYRVLPDVGHISNLEAPDVVNRELAELWLSVAS